MEGLPVSFSPSCKRMKLFLTGGCNLNPCRDWSALPGSVVVCIMDKLTHVQDYVRFGAVCPPWRSIFLQEISNSSGRPPCCSRLPFLLIPPPPPQPPQPTCRRQRALYSLSTLRVYDFRLPVPHTNICRGSSFGWLITLQTKSRYDCTLQLENPFLNRITPLPPPPVNLLQRHPEHIQPWAWDGYNVRKGVLSSDPLLCPNDFLVMAIMGEYGGLAFYKPGGDNPTWTPIGNWYSMWLRYTMFVDVIFFHKTKQFYAVTGEGQVFAVDFSGDDHNPKLTQVAPSPNGPGAQVYLVEDVSLGDLFQVHIDTTGVQRPEDVKVVVFKLDSISNQIWIKVDHLDGNIMFLGNSGSLLRAPSECPGCQPDCIYYTDDIDIRIRHIFHSCGPPSDAIYNLKSNTVQPHYSASWPNMREPRSLTAFTRCKKLLPQLIWLEPTLRGCC